jgi:hypothetical protein
MFKQSFYFAHLLCGNALPRISRLPLLLPPLLHIKAATSCRRRASGDTSTVYQLDSHRHHVNARSTSAFKSLHDSENVPVKVGISALVCACCELCCMERNGFSQRDLSSASCTKPLILRAAALLRARCSDSTQ